MPLAGFSIDTGVDNATGSEDDKFSKSIIPQIILKVLTSPLAVAIYYIDWTYPPKFIAGRMHPCIGSRHGSLQ